MSEEPLVYTVDGNVPVSELEYSTEWEVNPGKYVKFIETYKRGEKIVKQSAHVLQLKGLDAAAIGEKFQ